MKVLSENKIISVFILFVGSFLYYSNENLKVPAYDLLGSKFLPRVVCAAIIFLSIVLFFTREKGEQGDKKNQKFSYKSVILFLILSFFYLLALNYHLGFLKSTFFYLFILIFMLSNYKFKGLLKIIFFSLVSSCIIYYFFQIFLQLLLP